LRRSHPNRGRHAAESVTQLARVSHLMTHAACRRMDWFRREPRPITYSEQKRILPLLPDHLGRMVLFDLNTGARDKVVCGLKWEWEIPIRVPLG
jgi:integrase